MMDMTMCSLDVCYQWDRSHLTSVTRPRHRNQCLPFITRATPGRKSANGKVREMDCVSNLCLCKHRLGWTRSRFSFLRKPSLFTICFFILSVPLKGIFGSTSVWTKSSTKASGVCFLGCALRVSNGFIIAGASAELTGPRALIYMLMQKQIEIPSDDRLCVGLTISSCVTKQPVCFFKVDISYGVSHFPLSPFIMLCFLHCKWVFHEYFPPSLWPIQLNRLFLLLSTWNSIYSPFYFCNESTTQY